MLEENKGWEKSVFVSVSRHQSKFSCVVKGNCIFDENNQMMWLVVNDHSLKK